MVQPARGADAAEKTQCDGRDMVDVEALAGGTDGDIGGEGVEKSGNGGGGIPEGYRRASVGGAEKEHRDGAGQPGSHVDEVIYGMMVPQKLVPATRSFPSRHSPSALPIEYQS